YSIVFFFSSRRRHTRSKRDWSSTCALPICAFTVRRDHAMIAVRPLPATGPRIVNSASTTRKRREKSNAGRNGCLFAHSVRLQEKIGRASCRERVEDKGRGAMGKRREIGTRR